jgi:hypothetical protein
MYLKGSADEYLAKREDDFHEKTPLSTEVPPNHHLQGMQKSLIRQSAARAAPLTLCTFHAQPHTGTVCL